MAGTAVVQAGLTGRVVLRIGEARAALLGLSMGAIACVAFAFATAPWMVFVITGVCGLQALSYPALSALLTRHAPPDAQGELQGAIAALSSMAAILGPLLMSQVLAYFTAPNAPIQFAGAAFVAAAVLNLVGIATLLTQGAAASASSSKSAKMQT